MAEPFEKIRSMLRDWILGGSTIACHVLGSFETICKGTVYGLRDLTLPAFPDRLYLDPLQASA